MRAMSMPVRRCTNIELSPMLRAPSRNPNRARVAMKSGSSEGARSRGGAGVAPRATVYLKFFEMLMTAGPMTTTNRAGKMQNTMGMSIFTGAFWAFSWAR